MGSESSDSNDKGFAGPESLYHRIINIPENMDPALTHECWIYKIPVNLRQVKEKAYTPTLISIGPLHHGESEFAQMEKQKQRYFHFFWERLSNTQALLNYEGYLRQNEHKIRSCYSEKYDDKKTGFLDMILLDSVFIVELFLRNSNKPEQENDHMFTKPWISKTIQRDLLLLENQLPIFVLQELHSTVVPKENEKMNGNFLHLAHEYFQSFDRHNENCKAWESSIHFTDLIRYFHLPKHLVELRPSPSVVRNAMKLNEAGISFENLTGCRLLDIKFEKKPVFGHFLCLPYFNWFKARFQIPQLKVDHTTECVLRNLIAFEQCHYPDSPYICNYVSLIDSLIHTTGDVDLLVEKEVIVHELGSHKELATLVNGLCKHVVTDSTCYFQIITSLNQHYQKIWNRTMAALRLVYFRDPWRSSSTVVGIAVLVFTIFNFCRIVRVIF